MTKAAPGRRIQGTWIAAGLFALTVVAFLRPPLLPDIGRDLGLSATGLGVLGSVFAFGRLLADFPAGDLTERVRPGPMMAVAAGLVGAGSVLLAVSPGSAVAFVAVFVLGIGSTWTLTTAVAHFAGAPRQRRGVAMSVFAGALLAGQAVGPAAGGGLGSLGGWRLAMGLGGVLALVVAIPFLVRPGARRTPSEAKASGGAADPRATPLVLGVIYLLPAVQFAVGAAVVQTVIPIVADADLGLGPGIVGVALGVGGVVRFVSAIVSGQVTDRLGRRWALVPGLALQVAGLAVYAFVGSVAAMWIAIVLLSLGSVTVNVGNTMLADLSESGGLGRRLGAFRFTGDAAFMVGPVLAGVLLERSGRLAATMPFLLFTLAVTIACVLVLPETRHPDGA